MQNGDGILLTLNTNFLGRNVMLAMCWADGERKDTWEDFFDFVKHNAPAFLDPVKVCVSDRDKGLEPVLDKYQVGLDNDNVVEKTGLYSMNCVRHLQDNARATKDERNLIWNVSGAQTEQEFPKGSKRNVQQMFIRIFETLIKENGFNYRRYSLL